MEEVHVPRTCPAVVIPGVTFTTEDVPAEGKGGRGEAGSMLFAEIGNSVSAVSPLEWCLILSPRDLGLTLCGDGCDGYVLVDQVLVGDLGESALGENVEAEVAAR